MKADNVTGSMTIVYRRNGSIKEMQKHIAIRKGLAGGKMLKLILQKVLTLPWKKEQHM